MSDYSIATIRQGFKERGMRYELHLGDNREVLRSMPSDSVDSIVCDPPYELGFMGKRWDSTGIAYDVTLWAECLRVLKPGGHLLAFGGSRTYHRLAVAIEDAGFEVRDCIMWLYASGFPKSLAVDKAIDRQRHDREQVYQVTAWIRAMRDRAGLSNGDIDKAFGFHGMAGHWTSSASQPSVPTLDQIPPLLTLLGMTLDDVPDDVRTLIWTLNGRKGQPGEAWFQREVITEKRTDMFGEYEVEGEKTAGMGSGKTFGMLQSEGENYKANHKLTLTAPATPLAQQWQGWGTALKPAHEPIVVARKPLQGTVADNVQAWGVGALNIDGCRVGSDVMTKTTSNGEVISQNNSLSGPNYRRIKIGEINGRWPANIILDEEAAQMLDEQSGGASRFFYIPKASKAEREAGLDSTCTVKYNIDRSILGGLSWNDVGMATVQLLQKVTSELETLKWHIGESGESITVLYPKDSSFITSMEISKITALKTCNLLMHLLTSESTVDVNYEMEHGSSLAKNAEQLKAWILNITNGKMELARGVVSVALITLQKISESEPNARNNYHSTVKPIALMRYLVRMVTPRGGVVLDPFMGSGTTGCAAMLEAVRFIGIDITPEYVDIAERRIQHWASQNPMEL